MAGGVATLRASSLPDLSTARRSSRAASSLACCVDASVLRTATGGLLGVDFQQANGGESPGGGIRAARLTYSGTIAPVRA